jgi:acetyl-CoA carboxylase alpha subunit
VSLKGALSRALDEIEGTPPGELRRSRRAKFRAMGVFA